MAVSDRKRTVICDAWNRGTMSLSLAARQLEVERDVAAVQAACAAAVPRVAPGTPSEVSAMTIDIGTAIGIIDAFTGGGGIPVSTDTFGIQGLNASICPPGTACSGPSISLGGGVSGCLGSCKPTAETLVGGIGANGGGSNVGGIPTGVSGGCDLPTQAYCQTMCGTNGASCRSIGQCQLPNGRGGTLNKTKYYRFGDCRRGTSAGVVTPGSVCVKRRSMNYANPKAAMRAARRIAGATKHYERLLKAVAKVPGIKRSKR